MLNPRNFMRMAMWARNPPSWKRVMLVFAAILVALGIVGLDYFGLWPEWAKADRLPRGL
ncbi:hypothetical protein ABMC89_03585 [Sulfitobacter sp. HNIBRBA3233]|uniref:hypothetical protein n=1 Tax=Sulfitobacter marinivivus TaxID=3158558 RepID=UPI0032DEB423